MGSVFARYRKLYIRFKNSDDKWVQEPTKFYRGDEDKAQKLLREVEEGIRAHKEAAAVDGASGPITFHRFAKRWIEERKRRGLTSACEDEGRLKHHVYPVFANKRLDEIRPRHIREFVRALQAAKDPLAPRSIRNIYGMLHTLFRDAVVEELIPTNPCIVKHGELPEKIDKDPEWRSNALFMREEVETLISDPRIDEDRRVLYTVLFMAGLREGEMAALKWEHYDAETKPLGRLLVAYSYSTRLQAVKRVKTKIPRDVPVHPTLTRVLANWREEGWERLMGRAPTPEDLILPDAPYVGRGELYRRMLSDDPTLTKAELARRLGVSTSTISQGLARSPNVGRNGRPQTHGPYRTPTVVYNALQKDLLMLGMRPRRTHDTRRTMITLALNDGVRRDVLESITHGRKEQQSIDLYNSPLWTLKCDELAKLKIEMPGTSAEPQNESGPTEEAEPFAAGFAAGLKEPLEMIHFRSAPTTGLEPVAR